MGEAALRAPRCRAAWAEKRRRFFGVAHPDAYAELGRASRNPELTSVAPDPGGGK